MPIASVGATLEDKWKADLIAGWKKVYDKTAAVYGYGLVDGVQGDWNLVLQQLSDRNLFSYSNVLPEEKAQEWFQGWSANQNGGAGSIPGFNQYGSWNFVFGFARAYYLNGQDQTKQNTKIQRANTLYLQAERAAAKYNLDIYGAILRDYGSQLSNDEKEFLKGYFLDWKVLKPAADQARAGQILTRIGYVHTTPAAIQKQLHDVFIAAGGKEKEYMAIPSSESDRQVVSNGASQALTSADWSQVNQNQQVVTQLKDGSYVSPLNTSFLSPNPLPVAVTSVTPVTAQAGSKISPLMWLGIGFLALKLLRR